jgi:hypothetical protein
LNKKKEAKMRRAELKLHESIRAEIIKTEQNQQYAEMSVGEGRVECGGGGVYVYTGMGKYWTREASLRRPMIMRASPRAAVARLSVTNTCRLRTCVGGETTRAQART